MCVCTYVICVHAFVCGEGVCSGGRGYVYRGREWSMCEGLYVRVGKRENVSVCEKQSGCVCFCVFVMGNCVIRGYAEMICMCGGRCMYVHVCTCASFVCLYVRVCISV